MEEGAGTTIPGLKAAAMDALMDLLRAGKVSPGDLIKLVSLEEGGEEQGAACRDFLLQIREE
jgi:hypothetical protein